MFQEYPDYLSVSQVCEILAVETHAVYQLINNKINAIRTNGKLWRIPKNSLIMYVLTESGIDVKQEEINDYI